MSWILLILIFALLSGAEEYDEGIIGVIKNSPNALPWVVLFVVFWFVRKRDLLAGTILVLVGFLTIFVFNLYESFLVLALIPFPFLAIGLFLIFDWYSNRNGRK